jgi:hypothetical protein
MSEMIFDFGFAIFDSRPPKGGTGDPCHASRAGARLSLPPPDSQKSGSKNQK